MVIVKPTVSPPPESGSAHKGMLLAGKVLAATAIRLFSDRALLEASQRELRMPVSVCQERSGLMVIVKPTVSPPPESGSGKDVRPAPA
jgi:hypothetical protein